VIGGWYCGSAGTRATACFHKKEALSESFDPLAARGLQPHSFSAIFGQLTSDQKFRPARSSGSAAPFFKIDGRREVVRFEWPGAGPKGTSQAADTLGCSRSGVVSIEALKRMSPGSAPWVSTRDRCRCRCWSRWGISLFIFITITNDHAQSCSVAFYP
jgi:hypothetical protein